MSQSSRPRLTLRRHKAEALRRFHPWVFSGAIQRSEGDLADGAVVEVYDDEGEFLAVGHYGSGSIAVKVLAFEPVEDMQALLQARLEAAYALRQQVGLTENPQTNCYRLVNAEGDGLPGLIIDWYNGVAVMQAHSLGMYQQRQGIVEALQAIYGARLTALYDKSAPQLFRKSDQVDEYLLGESSTGEVLENGHRFLVDWETGQKTGFFLDQREHRALLGRYAQGQKVLNSFCYSGGFSVYALQAGARQVDSVDTSVKAIDWTKENITRNPEVSGVHAAFTEEVFPFLKDCDADYDVIVLDPPAFAKSQSARHQAVMAYKRLNQLAIAKLRPGGLLFTFSCSQVVLPEYFNGAVMAGAIEAGRPVKILHHLTQPPDHPISIYHPEGLYLKGLVLRVD
ncbi:MAG: class I SAM-dependent rRNA methyltransferase [Pegethrix bostrychoides GSE-TBD4-15B]|jgi:23S rRNA (cytosine1962-C5)-methyltransferase|uniref:Class I SAM-dependent rRNA methyltransferase n=1 Tax=Pegethrix bostrychoides GSE-TBD4-15B TaxID=2839662 RepID=A0A951PF16_9CYAN|nr:class I SAM-dependent rRNA methyltransferase [Pegethrix bostrychoides GSE-TBD4-15B]